MPIKRNFFWFAHSAGWAIYIAIILIFNYFDRGLNSEIVISALTIGLVGFALTSLLRHFYILRGWHRKNFKFIIGRSGLSALVVSFIYHLLVGLFNKLFFPEQEWLFTSDYSSQLEMMLTWTFLIMFWSIMFYTSNYFIGYRLEQIRALKLEAENKNFELRQLKSQLNPHFMFNALTSIKALVSENPQKAKDAILNLSSLLRMALSANTDQLIDFKEEIDLVKNYLELEKIRFEDNLEYEFNFSTESYSVPFPPMMLQTLVENAVKHGVSKLESGGKIDITSKVEQNYLSIEIWNDGKLVNKNNKGIGLENSKRRLVLIYQGQAQLHINQKGSKVRCTLKIPIQYEDANH